MDLFQFLLTCLFSIFGWEIGRLIKDRVKYPYRWRCQTCRANFHTNTKETLDEIKYEHRHNEQEANDYCPKSPNGEHDTQEVSGPGAVGLHQDYQECIYCKKFW